MESKTIYYLSMVTVVIYFNDNNQPVILLYPAIKDYMLELKGRKDVCDVYVQLLQGKTNGITLDVVKLRKDIGLYYGMCSSAISSHGASIGDSRLMEMDKINFSYLFRSKIEDLKETLINVLKEINLDLPAYLKYRINPAFITKLTDLQTNLNLIGVSTKVAINHHKDTKELLDEELKEIQKLLSEKIDTAAEMMQVDNTEEYKTYLSSRKVAHHHMHDNNPLPPDPTTGSLALTALDNITAAPIENATLTILSINFITTTDINGEISKDKFIPGEYIAKLTCPGRIPIDFTFVISHGEITDLGFMMEATTP